MKMNDTARTGRLGEVLAARYLRDRGYEILDANFRSKTGEIDIIATDGFHLCIVEVKSRREGQMFPPSDAVDGAKMRRLELTANSYKSLVGSELPLRYDVIEVVFRTERDYSINHIRSFGNG